MAEKEGRSLIYDVNEGLATPFEGVTASVDSVEQDIIAANEEVIDDSQEEVVDDQELDQEVEEEESDVPEEEDSVEPPDEEDEEEAAQPADDSDNYNYYIALQMQADGLLPEDMEISEDITGESIYQARLSQMEGDIESAIKQAEQAVVSSLAAQGYNEQDMQYAKLLRSGVDPRLLSEASKYQMLAEVDAEQLNADQKAEVIRAMYNDKGNDPEDIDAILEKAELDENFDSLVERSKAHFKGKYDKFVEEQKNQQARVQEQLKEKAEKEKNLVDSILKERSVLGTEIPESEVNNFKKALYDPTVLVDIGGEKYKATEFQEFLLNYENDLNTKIWAFRAWKYRDSDPEFYKKKGGDEREDKIFEGYRKAKASKKVPSKKTRKKANPQPSRKGRSYVVDGGVITPA